MRGRDSRLRALAVAVVLAAVPAAAAPRTIQERLGHPPDARLIVIHADDLGMAHSVNRATFEALEQGWITSASILVPCPWFPEVARWARAHPEADLGIHLALTSEWTGLRWRPLSAAEQVPSLLDADGYLPLVESTVAQRALPQEAERELRAQIERAKAAGIRFTHFDSHMNALFLTPALRDLYTRLAREHQVPLRWAKGLAGPDGGSVPADQVLLDGIVAVNPGVDPKSWRAEYQKLLDPLPPGVYELVVHLAYADEEMWGATGDHPDWGAAWRRYDLDLVKSPEFRQFLKDHRFVPVTWRELQRARAMP